MEQTPTSDGIVLCVDLDGTLLRSDLLVETALALLARRPWMLLAMLWWLAGGKARLKREIAARVALEPAHLPWDERVLDLVREAEGRHRVLCTASDHRLASLVSLHLGCFDEVIASDGERNLAGSRKASTLVERFGAGGFDYIGNAAPDLHVWAHARGAIVVNAGPGLARQAARATTLLAHLPAEGGGLRSWVRALRLHQWLKNLLVFVPLLASHRVLEPEASLSAGLAFLAFGLVASGVYLLNDLLDLPSDRQHARKRLRPFAAGTLPVLHGLVAAPLLTLAGLALGWLADPLFALVLAGYYALTLAYSLALKRVTMLDVMVLAGLYTVRIIGGAAAIGAGLSFWLLAFSMFVFLSLAMLKRYTELHAMLQQGRQQAAGRGYSVEDLPLLQSLGAAAGYLAVLVLALYIDSPEGAALYRTPEALWLLCPLMLYWISRVWVVAHRGAMHDDPIVFAVRDRVSQGVAVLGALVVLAALRPWP